jgi:hypothetical protein
MLPCYIIANIMGVFHIRHCWRLFAAVQVTCPATQVTGIPGATSTVPASTTNAFVDDEGIKASKQMP